MNFIPARIRPRPGDSRLYDLDDSKNTVVAARENTIGERVFDVTLNGVRIAYVVPVRETVYLNNGGSNALVTARRMNQTLKSFNVPFRVSCAGGWHVKRGGEKIAEFTNKVRLTCGGEVLPFSIQQA